MTLPLWVMIMTSDSSVTCRVATTEPLRSVVFILTTPLPPREVMRYSASGVRLPKPFSATVSMSVVSESLMCSFSSSSRFCDVWLCSLAMISKSGCAAAHGAHFRFAEENGLAFVAGQENHFSAIGKFCADQFILAVERDGDDSGGARIGEFGERGFFNRAVARGHEDELASFFEVARRDERGKFFIFLEFHKAGDGFAARGCGRFRELINF